MSLITKFKSLITKALSVFGDTTISGNLTVDTNTLFVDSVNNRVGIGTLSAGAKLELKSSTVTEKSLRIEGITSQSAALIELKTGSASASRAITLLDSSGSEVAYISNLGAIQGISLAAPIVSSTGGSVSNPSFNFGAPDSNTGMYKPANDNIGFVTNGVERVRVDSSGNVGIGTTTPNEKLTVSGNISATGSITATSATIPTINGNTDFSDDVEVVGELTCIGQPPLSALGDNHVLTKALGDARYGQFKFVALSANASQNNHTVNLATSLSLYLEAGIWQIESFLYCTTASNTGGIQCQMLMMNAGDTSIGSSFNSVSLHTVPIQRFTLGTGIFASPFVIIADGGATASNKTAYGYSNSVMVVSAANTYTITIRQRSATDAANPAILNQNSWFKATRLG